MRYLAMVLVLPHAPLRNRWLGQGTVVVVSTLLTGCPQLLDDDFHASQASSVGQQKAKPGKGTITSNYAATGGEPTRASAAASGGAEEVLVSSSGGGEATASGGTGGLDGEDSSGQGGSTSELVDSAAQGISDVGGQGTQALGGATNSTTESSRGTAAATGGTSALSTSESRGGTSAATTAPSTGGRSAATGAAGAGTVVSEVTSCNNSVVLRVPRVAGFDDWDGVTNLYDWRFPFNGSNPDAPVTATFDPYSDGSGDYSLTLMPGASGTRYAVRAANGAADRWGGGIRLLLHCFDASAYDGMSFWIKGSTPAKTIVVALGQLDKSADYQFVIPGQWTQMKIPFLSFRGWGSGLPGRNIEFIDFSSQLQYSTKGALPGAFEIIVDEVGFY